MLFLSDWRQRRIGYGWVTNLKLIDAPDGIVVGERPGYENPIKSKEDGVL